MVVCLTWGSKSTRAICHSKPAPQEQPLLVLRLRIRLVYLAGASHLLDEGPHERAADCSSAPFSRVAFHMFMLGERGDVRGGIRVGGQRGKYSRDGSPCQNGSGKMHDCKSTQQPLEPEPGVWQEAGENHCKVHFLQDIRTHTRAQGPAEPLSPYAVTTPYKPKDAEFSTKRATAIYFV